MSRAEMFYYYGILNRKVHKTTKKKIQLIQQAEAKGQIKELFAITKVERPRLQVALEEPKTSFEAWKDTFS